MSWSDDLRVNLPPEFFTGLARGALRVAHPRWLFAAIEGADPRLRLTSHLRTLGLGVAQISSLLTRRTLGSVRLLDLSAVAVDDLDWRAIAARASLPSLVALRIDPLGLTARRALEEADLFAGVRRLCVRTRRHGDLDAIAKTLASPMFRGVEEVVTSSSYDFEGLARALYVPGALPSLTTWEAASRTAEEMWTDSHAFDHVRGRVARMRLVLPSRGPSMLRTLSRMSFAGLRELDLSGLMPRLDEGSHPGSRANAVSIAAKHLPGSALARSVPRLMLGDLRTPALVATLERDGVEVTG